MFRTDDTVHAPQLTDLGAHLITRDRRLSEAPGHTARIELI